MTRIEAAVYPKTFDGLPNARRKSSCWRCGKAGPVLPDLLCEDCHDLERYGSPRGAFEHRKRWALQPDTARGALARITMDYDGTFDEC